MTPDTNEIKDVVAETCSEVESPVAVELPDNGYDVSLTGQQVRFIRKAIGDTQVAFARRIGVSQSSVCRLEEVGPKPMSGPDVILVALIAQLHKIEVPTEFPEEEGVE